MVATVSPLSSTMATETDVSAEDRTSTACTTPCAAPRPTSFAGETAPVVRFLIAMSGLPACLCFCGRGLVQVGEEALPRFRAGLGEGPEHDRTGLLRLLAEEGDLEVRHREGPHRLHGRGRRGRCEVPPGSLYERG